MFQRLAKASFAIVDKDGAPSGKSIPVHFNPMSLQVSLTNNLQNTGNSDNTKQSLSQTSATLALELTFDSTDTGQDVRESTLPIALLMKPIAGASGAAAPKTLTPPVVLFSWGNFQFQGMLTSYRETLDFFSPEGVPLRAAVSISMAAQDKVFDDKHERAADVGGGDDSVLSVGLSASAAASLGGDARGARGIAGANGLASLRFDAGVGFEVGASLSISAAAGFATGASAGIGIGGGIGAGVSAGAGIGVGASAGIGVSGGASAGFSGASSLAAFGDLRAPPAAAVRLNPQALLPAPGSAALSVDAGAGFGVAGAARPGAASFSAEVG